MAVQGVWEGVVVVWRSRKCEGCEGVDSICQFWILMNHNYQIGP